MHAWSSAYVWLLRDEASIIRAPNDLPKCLHLYTRCCIGRAPRGISARLPPEQGATPAGLMHKLNTRARTMARDDMLSSFLAIQLRICCCCCCRRSAELFDNAFYSFCRFVGRCSSSLIDWCRAVFSTAPYQTSAVTDWSANNRVFNDPHLYGFQQWLTRSNSVAHGYNGFTTERINDPTSTC